MKPRVNTTHYEFAHGRKPRGKGWWAFGPFANTDSRHVAFFEGTFTEAKAKAQVDARFKTLPEIFVQS